MKMERVSYVGGKFPNDVRNVVVSDYKDVLTVGNCVIIEGKKHIVIAKEDSKCVVMDLQGNVKRYYYKYIDFMYLTKETSRDADVINFMKQLNIPSYGIIDYENNQHQFRCQDGELHSYSFLLSRYLKQRKRARIV